MLLLAILAIPALALAAKAPTTATQLLAKAKAASGGAAWNRIHSLRSKGTIKGSGLAGTYTGLEDLSTGRSVAHIKLGPIALAQGFDGKQGWAKRPGGEVAPDNSPDAKQSDVNEAYRTARAWWFPQRWPGKLESLGTRSDDDKTFQVLRITPRGGRPFELWINAKTHLVERSVERSSDLPQTTYFSDFRTVHGVKMPFRQRVSNGRKQYDRVLQINRVAVNVPVSAANFAMPKQVIHDTSIVGGGNRTTIPFKLVNDVILIPVSVNGHSLEFAVDTGGVAILTRRAAKRIGIEGKGALQGGGFGKKSVDVAIAKVKKLVLGGKVELRNQEFFIFPIANLSSVLATKFDGSVGYGLLKRFVVRVDYANHKLTFIRSDAFDPADAGTAVPFTSSGGGAPLVKASIDGIPGVFKIDTGSIAALTLYAPYVKSHDLYSRYSATPATIAHWGIGGSSRARFARGGLLKIGSVAVNDPVLALSTAKKGASANKRIAGNIGGKILKRFTVTFDYAHQKMYLKPNKNYGMPMNYDRSGMWIKGKGKNLVIKSVMAGGPAEKAGLETGDVITAVDGKPDVKIGLSGFREMLRSNAPGTRLKLTVAHGNASRNVTLTLRRLIPEKGGLKR
ncbi:MAG TPA: PDZ domain-containing protein [Rhodanobacteraceae bacterium]|nr:PDZ domain-containing protein [Rhodanobacteraceae bacterium]